MQTHGVAFARTLVERRELGCHHAQGFLFAKPLEQAEADALLAERAAVGANGARRGVILMQ
jgi:EAL domain-containing protein (putative c-di-GMP-specific phosphodiesterase class I)